MLERTDGTFSIDVSDNKMSTTLSARKPSGGSKPLSLKDVSAAILALGLEPLEKEQIRDGVLRWNRSYSRVLTAVPLCEGKPAEAGTDAEVDWDHPCADEESATLLRERLVGAAGLSSEAEFPSDQAQWLVETSAQHIICSLVPGRPPTAGADVFGATIESAAGSGPTFQLHENVSRRENDFIAQEDGVVETVTEVDGGGAVTIHLRVHATCRSQSRWRLTGWRHT